MLESIITALITGVVTITGVVMSNNKKQAVTDTKLEELTREVREHNNFARRVPILETKVENIEQDIRKIEQQIDRLEVR